MHRKMTAVLAAAFASWTAVSFAQHGIGGMDGHDMSTMPLVEKAAHAGHPGAMIRQATVEGYTMTYHLLDLRERAEYMKGMAGMKMDGMSDSPEVTNHLVVFIQKGGGPYSSGKVGFQVTSPDGKVFSTLTMGMSGGYGADVMLTGKGVYRVKTKAVVGDTTLWDEFSHEVK